MARILFVALLAALLSSVQGCKNSSSGGDTPAESVKEPDPETEPEPEAPPPLSVQIHAPVDGFLLLDTLVVEGISTSAENVFLSLDGNPEVEVNGVAQWEYPFATGAIAAGNHEITVRAIGSDGEEVTDRVTFAAADPIEGLQTITYISSVDGAVLEAKLWLPAGHSIADGPKPLMFHLHGGGGAGTVQILMRPELDARNWIGLAPSGRQWGLHDLGCGWSHSAAYVDNPDPNVGPGEQDILDAMHWAIANKLVDPDRVFLSGGSMGGRGTYAIGLKNPDLFAGIAPMQPAIDMYEIFVRRNEAHQVCKEGMVGGIPGDSPWVDTMYTITSGRFLIENAYNLPVFHGHGLDDNVANNVPSADAPFLHGFHMTTDSDWSDCHGGLPAFCFGHTPTLSELQARHPDGYPWAYLFSPGGHQIQPMWYAGTAMDPQYLGVEDPASPGNLHGSASFFDGRTVVKNPETLVYKTYTDTHRRAYWAEIDITTPWQDIPGAIRARRNQEGNEFHLELIRVGTVTLDLEKSDMALSESTPLKIFLSMLDEDTYDPALKPAADEVLQPTVVLRGEFADLTSLSVFLNDTPLPAESVSLEEGFITIQGIEVKGKDLVQIQAP